MITRKLCLKIQQLIKNIDEFNNVILVEGARQVGKTTLIRQVLKSLGLNHKEINLEEELIFAEKIDQCENFSAFEELLAVDLGFQPGKGVLLFIDEAQESRKLGGFIRFMKEKWPHTQVILSGSILSRIFRDNIRYPVGRVTHIHVQPFGFEEFLEAAGAPILLDKLRQFQNSKTLEANTHRRLLELLEQYLEVGGLPEVVTTFLKHGDWKEARNNILLGYYNDFKRVFGEENQAFLIASLKACAYLLGSPFKNSFVAALLEGGNHQKIIQSLTRLETWKMILPVEQKGPTVEKNYHPKRYLFDIGIAKQLREAVLPQIRLIGKDPPEARIPLGGILENITASVLFSSGYELTGWKKSSSGSEVDFIVKMKNQIVPMECKAATAIKGTHLGGLRDFMRLHRLSLGIVVSLAPFEIKPLPHHGKVIVLPLYLLESWENLCFT